MHLSQTNAKSTKYQSVRVFEAGKRMDVKRLLCRQAGIKLAELHVAHPINRAHIKQQLASIVAEL